MSTFARTGLTILTAAAITAGCQSQGREVVEVVKQNENIGIVKEAANLSEVGQISLFASQTMTACYSATSQLIENLEVRRKDNQAQLFDFMDAAVNSSSVSSDSATGVSESWSRASIVQSLVPVLQSQISADANAIAALTAKMDCGAFAAISNGYYENQTEQKKNSGEAWRKGATALLGIGAAAYVGTEFIGLLSAGVNALGQPSNSTVINGDNNATGTAGRDQNDVSVSTAGGIPVNATDLTIAASEETTEETDETGLCPTGYNPVDDGRYDGIAEDGTPDGCSDGNGGSVPLL